MYLLCASAWNTPTGYGGSDNVNASLHCKCKAKDVQLLLDIIACFQCLLMGSQGHCSWLLGRHVDCEERLAVKELVLVLIYFILCQLFNCSYLNP